jgi:hypothetical protein
MYTGIILIAGYGSVSISKKCIEWVITWIGYA